MSQLQERIAQFRKMAQDDPDNELGHYRLGLCLLEDNQLSEAIRSFQRTLELSPYFSKVYQLLGQAQLQSGQKDEAITTLRKGYEVADERGDNMPRTRCLGCSSNRESPPPCPSAARPRQGRLGLPKRASAVAGQPAWPAATPGN